MALVAFRHLVCGGCDAALGHLVNDWKSEVSLLELTDL
jgi:hypothetical protein